MLEFYKPEYSELWFREQLLSDEATMSYNHAWGGTIPFPESSWQAWYERWVIAKDEKRFYRYLLDTDSNAFVGEAAFHFEERQGIWLADIIISAKHRNRGFGARGLALLCAAAASRGIVSLYDNIAVDNPGISLFRKAGFTEESRSFDVIMLKKDLL